MLCGRFSLGPWRSDLANLHTHSKFPWRLLQASEAEQVAFGTLTAEAKDLVRHCVKDAMPSGSQVIQLTPLRSPFSFPLNNA